jgi:molecular chaperone GrpE
MNEINGAPDGAEAVAKEAVAKETAANQNGATATADGETDGAELEALRKKAVERDQYLDLLQRTRAEFENYQKRVQKDREQERRYMSGEVLSSLLPVLDNLERAVAAAQQAGEKGPLVEGVAMVQNQFLELFKRYGITRIDALDKVFDPHLHQAVMQQAADKAANTVVQVLEQGYLNQDRVLRPAKVIVSK